MKVLSLNVAQPRIVSMHGKPVLTAIDKLPVAGRRRLESLGIDGDGQADLTVHGGVHQAVYGYPFEHYDYWQKQLGEGPLAYGMFGENLTTTGLLETEVLIGDQYRIGTTVLEVTSPRMPCFKFAHKIGHPEILKPFLRSGYSGFYFRVLQAGELGEGDGIELIHRPGHGITMRTLLGLMRLGEGDRDLLERARALTSISPLVHNILSERLADAFSTPQ